MGFKKFEKGSYRGSGGKDITLRQSKSIGISQLAVEEWFSDHGGVVVYFDESDNKIGLEPADPEDEPDAYTLNKSQGSGSVQAGSFLNRYELVPDETTAYEATWDDEQGLVVVDLDEPKN